METVKELTLKDTSQSDMDQRVMKIFGQSPKQVCSMYANTIILARIEKSVLLASTVKLVFLVSSIPRLGKYVELMEYVMMEKKGTVNVTASAKVLIPKDSAEKTHTTEILKKVKKENKSLGL